MTMQKSVYDLKENINALLTIIAAQRQNHRSLWIMRVELSGEAVKLVNKQAIRTEGVTIEVTKLWRHSDGLRRDSDQSGATRRCEIITHEAALRCG